MIRALPPSKWKSALHIFSMIFFIPRALRRKEETLLSLSRSFHVVVFFVFFFFLHTIPQKTVFMEKATIFMVCSLIVRIAEFTEPR